LEDEHDVVAAVAVGADHHAGIPSGIQRQELRAKVEPPLANRRCVTVGETDLANLLPRPVFDATESGSSHDVPPVLADRSSGSPLLPVGMVGVPVE
jgi:hypothetical protein